MTPDQAKADYRAVLKEQVTVRRYGGAGSNRPYFDAVARGRVTGYEPHELIGTVIQGDRKVILYADDLIDAGLALPITSADRLRLNGTKEIAIIAADGDTRKVAGVLIAYEIQARG